MGRGRKTVPLFALALVATPWLSGTAGAASSCLWDPGSATLEVTVDGETTLIVSGAAIMLGGSPCDAGATTSTVDLITIKGDEEIDALTLDLAGGAFGPGAEVEPTGTSEIEFAINLGAGADELTLAGTSGKDELSIGTDGTNLNADNDVDATLSGVDAIMISAGGNNDTLDAGGDSVVGAASPVPITAEGEAGDDALIGGDDDDVLMGGLGQDTIDGGAGRDEVSFAAAPDSENVYLAEDTAFGGDGVDTILRLEDVIGSTFPDLLIGDASANRLLGGTGNDVINGAGGNDDLIGEEGLDTAAFFGSPSGVVVNVSLGTATGWGTDSLASVENVHGSAQNDVITGSAASNILSGSGGNDGIFGSGGPDYIFGGVGNDRIRPGLGADRAVGGEGTDTIDLSTATGSVTINLGSGRSSGQGSDRIPGFERALASSFADRIVGNGARNVLTGSGGNDRLAGVGRADRLIGGSGRDSLSGGAAVDELLGGTQHDVLTGAGGNDTLRGGGGPDLLHGNGGNDALYGGSGTDTCHQGPGSGPRNSCELPSERVEIAGLAEIDRTGEYRDAEGAPQWRSSSARQASRRRVSGVVERSGPAIGSCGRARMSEPSTRCAPSPSPRRAPVTEPAHRPAPDPSEGKTHLAQRASCGYSPAARAHPPSFRVLGRGRCRERIADQCFEYMGGS